MKILNQNRKLLFTYKPISILNFQSYCFLTKALLTIYDLIHLVCMYLPSNLIVTILYYDYNQHKNKEKFFAKSLFLILFNVIPLFIPANFFPLTFKKVVVNSPNISLFTITPSRCYRSLPVSQTALEMGPIFYAFF